MKASIILSLILVVILFVDCNEVYNQPPSLMVTEPGILQHIQLNNFHIKVPLKPFINEIITGTVKPATLLQFAHTLKGVPYMYSGADSATGFDCSGFITYVFNHFQISVPRASVDFTNLKEEIPLNKARPGDLILFTGTDSTTQEVGHMGIIDSITSNQVYFIHASSGKANGVTTSLLDNYYRRRFVKLIRVFP